MKARISLLLVSIFIGAVVSITGVLSGLFHPIVGLPLSAGILVGLMVEGDDGDFAGRVLTAFVIAFFVAFGASAPGYEPPHLNWYRFYSWFFFLFLPITAYNVVIWIRNGASR